MSEAIKEQAKEYYPEWWSMRRLLALKEKGKLTDAEIQEIVTSKSDGEN